MALNPSLLSFFLARIKNSRMETFGAEVNHLFQHLDNEIKDNLIFQKYENERAKWKSQKRNYSWSLPTDFEDAKSLAYDLYRQIAETGSKGYTTPGDIFYSKNGNYNEYISIFNSQLIGYLEKALEDIIKANPEIETEDVEKVSGNTVFIIHGHDNALKTEVQLLLTRTGVNNLVLHEQPDKGRTIIDKLVQESKNANYAIALFTPDDLLQDGSNRARQNVVLEVGYFMGKLGKERVRLLVKGNIEIPSDLSGILYEKYDLSGAWKVKLLKELIAVGIYVDMNEITKIF